MSADLIPYLITTLVFMGGLGLVLAGVLAIANRKLFVQEDPRIDEVEEMLPGTNCGACGSPGCRAFAEACVGGQANPSLCTVSSREQVEFIADYLGVEASQSEKLVARLACAGGNHVARMRACVVACPLNLFSLHPVSHKLWVACKSLAEGDEALADCEVACTGCARCAADAPEGLITIQNNLAIVDYAKNNLATPLPTQRCPTGAIVWLEDGKAIKGQAARKIIRKEPLPIRPDRA